MDNHLAYRWHDKNNILLFNPACKNYDWAQLEDFCSFHVEGHYIISTSGSSGREKWTAISKEAVLASARAVNSHLNATPKDIWLHALPEFHVGGLGIHARAYLANSQVIKMAVKWDPFAFHDLASSCRATFTALVPAQVYDLAKHRLEAPAWMRAVIVGGGFLPPDLYETASALGWKLYPSYGMTECASQIATGTLGNPNLQPLGHVQVRIGKTGRISLSSPSLLSYYIWKEKEGWVLADPKREGWFETEDRGSLEGGYLVVNGRMGDFIKIGGESVDVAKLEKILEVCKAELQCAYDAALVPVPDGRLGHVLHLAAAALEAGTLVEAFNSKVLPFERIRKAHFFEELPRTPLRKIIKSKLVELISNLDRKLPR